MEPDEFMRRVREQAQSSRRPTADKVKGDLMRVINSFIQKRTPQVIAYAKSHPDASTFSYLGEMFGMAGIPRADAISFIKSHYPEQYNADPEGVEKQYDSTNSVTPMNEAWLVKNFSHILGI